MNRRSFFDTILKAGAGCMILPTAITYTRHWSGLLVPQDPAVGWTTKLFLWRGDHWEEQGDDVGWQPPLVMPPGVQLLPMEVRYD